MVITHRMSYAALVSNSLCIFPCRGTRMLAFLLVMADFLKHAPLLEVELLVVLVEDD